MFPFARIRILQRLSISDMHLDTSSALMHLNSVESPDASNSALKLTTCSTLLFFCRRINKVLNFLIARVFVKFVCRKLFIFRTITLMYGHRSIVIVAPNRISVIEFK